MYNGAFEAAPIAHIVVDAGGTLAMYNERARSLFGLAPADIGRPFHELELWYCPVELRSPIHDAQEHRRLVVLKDVRLEGRDGEPRTLDVQVTPLFDPQGRGLGASVTFADASRVQELQQQLTRSKQDLESTYEEPGAARHRLEPPLRTDVGPARRGGPEQERVRAGHRPADRAVPPRAPRVPLRRDGDGEPDVDAINRRGKAVQCTVTCTPLFGKGHIQGVIVMVDEAAPD